MFQFLPRNRTQKPNLGPSWWFQPLVFSSKWLHLPRISGEHEKTYVTCENMWLATTTPKKHPTFFRFCGLCQAQAKLRYHNSIDGCDVEKNSTTAVVVFSTSVDPKKQNEAMKAKRWLFSVENPRPLFLFRSQDGLSKNKTNGLFEVLGFSLIVGL